MFFEQLFAGTVFPHKAFAGDFKPGFTVDLMCKDVGLALATGEELGVPMFLSSLIRNLYNVMRARGQGGQDFTAILTLLEEAAKIEARLEPENHRQKSAENSTKSRNRTSIWESTDIT